MAAYYNELHFIIYFKMNSDGKYMYSYEPAHEIMVLITQATSEGSGELAHPRSVARAFALRSHEVWK